MWALIFHLLKIINLRIALQMLASAMHVETKFCGFKRLFGYYISINKKRIKNTLHAEICTLDDYIFLLGNCQGLFSRETAWKCHVLKLRMVSYPGITTCNIISQALHLPEPLTS